MKKNKNKSKDEIDKELVEKEFEDTYLAMLWECEYVDRNKLTETALYFLKLGREKK